MKRKSITKAFKELKIAKCDWWLILSGKGIKSRIIFIFLSWISEWITLPPIEIETTKNWLLWNTNCWAKVIFIMSSKIFNYITFNWNLINKTNKQAKYNQRHWNWEQADSDQRGAGGDNGGKGERVYRNNYKGHMDSNKGGGNRGGRWERMECWAGVGGKGQKTILEQ